MILKREDINLRVKSVELSRCKDMLKMVKYAQDGLICSKWSNLLKMV